MRPIKKTKKKKLKIQKIDLYNLYYDKIKKKTLKVKKKIFIEPLVTSEPYSRCIKLNDIKERLLYNENDKNISKFKNIRCSVMITYFKNEKDCGNFLKKHHNPIENKKLSIGEIYNTQPVRGFTFDEKKFLEENEGEIFLYEFSGNIYVMKSVNEYLLTVVQIYDYLDGIPIKNTKFQMYYYFVFDSVSVSNVNDLILVEVWEKMGVEKSRKLIKEIKLLSNLIENDIELIFQQSSSCIFYYKTLDRLDESKSVANGFVVYKNYYDMYVPADNFSKIIDEEKFQLEEMFENLKFELSETKEESENWLMKIYIGNHISNCKKKEYESDNLDDDDDDDDEIEDKRKEDEMEDDEILIGEDDDDEEDESENPSKRKRSSNESHDEYQLLMNKKTKFSMKSPLN